GLVRRGRPTSSNRTGSTRSSRAAATTGSRHQGCTRPTGRRFARRWGASTGRARRPVSTRWVPWAVPSIRGSAWHESCWRGPRASPSWASGRWRRCTVARKSEHGGNGRPPAALLIAGGYGVVGEQAARLLRERNPSLPLLLGGRHPERARTLADAIGARA